MSDPAVWFTDAQALVIDYLDAHLAEPVVSRVPTERPAAFVKVLRTGGPRRNGVTDEPQITVESWSSSDEEAMDLAQWVRYLMHALVGQTVDGHPVYRVDELAGPANLPDPLSNQARVTQSFSIAIRGYVPTGS